MINKRVQPDTFNSFNCFFNSVIFQNTPTNNKGFRCFDKLVNVGGFDVIDVKSTSCYLRFTEGVTLLGGGINNPKLGEARDSDINPGIDDYYENNICVSTKNNRNWLLRAGGS